MFGHETHFGEDTLSNFLPTVLSVSAQQPRGFTFEVNCIITFETVQLVHWMPGRKSCCYDTGFAKTKYLATSDSESWKTVTGF